ncbi:N-acetyl-gamma-glutamyl-phosphate reductase [Sphingomonas sp.]|uniref:N-acetyl-gamma-glutamyl-phosphate reductase n=1 Tax=Sphingomonas sp. TaxID=28214 RepID=UPI000DB301CF|nr:N-acetyl-gamma-glutamyl-phosphate reductase [Sphingomonas sp.]PZU10366.1 MAG: N-acetyl-gamma-glutamyl-phosphate reductase [Sphingomonas sp.]
MKIFVDGAVGTTGLEIGERLTGRAEIELLTLPEERRKDPAARGDALNAADIVILCLPDDAAREAVALLEGSSTRIIDASTAHRIAPGWAYGFPELEAGTRQEIGAARLVANPGCYPTGFLALVRPLVRAGLLPAESLLSVNATSGYSGGGKSMISAFEDPNDPGATDTAFRTYGMNLAHKHVPEMTVHAGLKHPPIFLPAVARAYRGMIVEVPIHLHALPGTPRLGDLRAALADHYAGSALVRVIDEPPAMLTIERLAGTDRIDLFVYGDEKTGQARLVAALDNLGKGAAGAAVQNMNLMAGLPETAGLRL